ncbi:MAG: C39 family peptidase [Chloroflexi bacterium]|nr:C39 family peptidase [Chloroflexota bacterium]
MGSPTPYARAAGSRSDHSLFVPVLLVVACLAALVITLPFSGVHLPGERRLYVLLDRIPQPWKPPRPLYVLPPDPAEVAALPADPAGAGVPAVPAAPDGSAVTPAATAVAAPSAGTSISVEPIRSTAQASAAATQVAQAVQAVTRPAAEASPATPVAAGAAPVMEESAPEPALPALPAPPSAKLDGFRHQWQTWNNCGPATITMATSYFGRPETQAQAAPWLKPNPNDKNVGPDELVAYARSLGLRAEWRAGGDLDRLKLLLANNVPVITSIWITPKPNDGLGHYRLLVGYDDAAGRFTAYDSFVPPGADLTVSYGQLDEEWRGYNRTYIAVYRSAQADVVAAILGADRDDQAMFERALAAAQAEAAARPNDAFAWFNAGTNLVALGRTSEAVAAFDRARALRLPWRMLWYQFGPFEAYLAEGRVADVLALTGANLQQTGDLEESHYYRGRALQAQGQTAAARASYQAALRTNPKYQPAYHALATLG